MSCLRLFSLCVLSLLTATVCSAEPTVTRNGWSNVPGVVEGTVTTRAVDTTLPRPPLGYVEYLPKGYDPSDRSVAWPLLVFCTGIGEIGDGTDSAANGHQLRTKMIKHGPLYQITSRQWDFPGIVIVPQQPGYWNNAGVLKSVFEYAKANYQVDPTRMYLTGLCDGAVGVLNFASQNPGYLAAIMPIEVAAAPQAGRAAAIRNLPTWAVHCFNDPDIARTSSIAWVDQAAQADLGASNVMATYPGYAGKSYHMAVDADPSTGLPLNQFGPTTTIFASSLTAGSSFIGFGAATFGSAAFNTWGGTDAAPYARVRLGVAPDIWAKTGVIFRDSTAPGAMQVMVAQGPNQEVFMQWRTSSDGISGGTGRFGGSGAAKWLKLVRSGSLFTGSYSVDGSAWTVIGSRTVGLANSGYLAGLAVNSHNVKKLYTQEFTGLTIGGVTPGALVDADIGQPALSGSAAYLAGTWSVTGGGADIWGVADQFNYYHTAVSGDQTIIVKVGGNGPAADVVALGKPKGLYLTRPYAGPTAVRDVYLQLPVGYNATAYQDPSTAAWAWQRGQPWDQTRAGKRIFTMFWYQNHVQGWLDTYANGGCWDWLFSQQAQAAPVIRVQPLATTVSVGMQASFSVAAIGTAPLTYQWMRDGSAIAGATGATYLTPAAAMSDNGASYAVTVANALGQAGSTAAALLVSPDALTVVDFGDHQVVQRVIGTSAGSIEVRGTYAGTPHHIQARVITAMGGTVVVDWSTIVTTPAGGIYHAGLAVPQGGWYRLEVRSRDVAGVPIVSAGTTAKWGVGINILCIGQSNMLGFGDRAYTVADDRVGLLFAGTNWRHMADPWIGGGKASCGPALGNALVAALDLPIGLVPSAAGTTYMVGTSWNVLTTRNEANPGDTGTVYGQALSAARTAGGVEFVLVSQGANEAVAGNSTASYVGAFTRMRGNFALDLPGGPAVVFALSQLGRRINTGSHDVGYDAIREAHRQLDDGTAVLLAGSTLDFPIVDATSHYGGISQAAHGRRFARALLHSLGRRADYGGPRIVQARFLDGGQTTIRVTLVQHGGDGFLPGGAVPGFVVTDDLGPVFASGLAVDATTIDLQGPRVFIGAATITYLAGKDPAGPAGLLADNQAEPEPVLPMTKPLAVVPAAALPATEPALINNGWSNIAGVVEGALSVRPVDTTLPRPPYGYLEYLPAGYATAAAWPLVIHLPSISEAGDGTDSVANGHQLYNQLVKSGPLFQVASRQWDFPAIIIAPQVATNWAKPLNVKNVVAYVMANYRVDVNRIYMTGALEGANGALRYAVAYPADLAGALTVETSIAASAAQATAARHLPLWAAHSFADPSYARSSSIGWIDALATAQGGGSDVMARYPGCYGRHQFAVDVDPLTGRPRDANGAITAVTAATLVPGSKTITFPSGSAFGSNVFGMWGGSDALPFARVMVAGDANVYTVARGYPSSVTLTAAYAGSATTANITIQTPVGYHATAYREAAGTWGWNRGQQWDQTHPDQQILTLFWYQTAAEAWSRTWDSVDSWNWLFSRLRAPAGSS